MYLGLPSPKLANGFAAAIASMNRRRFLTLAQTHNLAAELGSSQMAKAYADGTFSATRWLAEVEPTAARQLDELRSVLVRSLLKTVVIVVVALGALAAVGKVGTTLPIDHGKAITAIGLGAAAWGTIIQVRPVEPTFRRNYLHEVAQGFVMNALIIGGLLLGAVGALWWQ
ncbi:hypothetical protein HUU62_16900 [Rhodoferax sp. 4810]|nr:hypothetical protein [Rhodoferax jenense]